MGSQESMVSTPGKILECVDLVAEGLTDPEPLLVQKHVDLESGGLEAVLIQEEGEIGLLDIAQIDKAGTGVYRRVDETQTALQNVLELAGELVNVSDDPVVIFVRCRRREECDRCQMALKHANLTRLHSSGAERRYR